MERTITRTVRRKHVFIHHKRLTKDAVASQTYFLVNRGCIPLSYKITNQQFLEDYDRKLMVLTIHYIYVGKRTARNWLFCHALRKEYNANRSANLSIIFNAKGGNNG